MNVSGVSGSLIKKNPSVQRGSGGAGGHLYRHPSVSQLRQALPPIRSHLDPSSTSKPLQTLLTLEPLIVDTPSPQVGLLPRNRTISKNLLTPLEPKKIPKEKTRYRNASRNRKEVSDQKKSKVHSIIFEVAEAAIGKQERHDTEERDSGGNSRFSTLEKQANMQGVSGVAHK